MKIGGFQEISLLDYPGKISSIVFTVTCNLRCPFCYVPQLVLPSKIKKLKLIPQKQILSYLVMNKELIDAVVVTGGEPTLQPDLCFFVEEVKSEGFLVALETNGTHPEILKHLIKNKLVDYVEMDVKTRLDFNKYNQVVGGKLTMPLFQKIKESIHTLLNSPINYEFRTTLMKEFHSKEDIIEVCKSLKGTRNYYLQNVKTEYETLAAKTFTPFTEKEIKEIMTQCKRFINSVNRRTI